MASPRTLLRIVSSVETAPAQPEELTDTELFVRYSPHIARIGLRLLGRNAEVDDLVQEVFFAAFKQRHQLRDMNTVKGWLSVIAVRTARQFLRRRRLRQFVGLDTGTPPIELRDQTLSPDQRALFTRVYQVLDHMNVECRLAWTLRYIEGEKLEAIAERLGCSLATAKRRIAAAHTQLLSELNHG